MSQLLLGKTLPDNQPFGLNLVPKKTLATHVFGITGSRKTSLQLHMIKEAKKKHPDAQVVIFSREGDEVVLRKYFDMILIGNNGEIPIDVKLAKLTGEQIRKQGQSVIIDITSLKTEKEQDEYMAGVLDGLMLDDQRKFWKRLCIVMIDEVQLYCNSSASKARDAIVRLVTLSRKRSIIPIFGSHQLKDMYWKARNDIGNVIIGYLKDPDQRVKACELLMIDKSEADTIAGFQNEPFGRFYAEGYDLTTPAKVFQLENDPEPDLDGEIPPLSVEGMQQADALRQSLSSKDKLSLETQLRFEIAELRSRNDQLSLNQISEKNILGYKEEGFKIGYNKAIDDTLRDFELSRPSGIVGMFKPGPLYEIRLDGWRKKLVRKN